LLIALFSLAALTMAISAHKSLDLGWEWQSVDGGLSRVMYSFSMGIMLYRLRIQDRPSPTWFALLPIIFLCMFLLAPTQSTKFAFIFCAVISPLIVFAGSKLEVPQVLQSWCAYVGNLSYPIYMCHRGFTDIYEKIGVHLGLPDIVRILFFLLFVTVVSACAQRASVFLLSGTTVILGRIYRR
jgi:peptidoglycan/LPS O-acetylase OafA/YrhL